MQLKPDNTGRVTPRFTKSEIKKMRLALGHVRCIPDVEVLQAVAKIEERVPVLRPEPLAEKEQE